MNYETMMKIELNGGYQWHEQGDIRLLKDIHAYKPKSLLDRIIDWVRNTK